MNRRQRRAFMAQFQSQVEQERNGAPVPPEVAAMMTKPKPKQVLHQVVVDWANEDGSTELMPVFPAVIEDCARMFQRAIEEQISLGTCRTMRNPRIVPCMPLQGVH
jgi:hypothetical protein